MTPNRKYYIQPSETRINTMANELITETERALRKVRLYKDMGLARLENYANQTNPADA